ncbi:hypothetical protein Tco_1266911, partial [Tanacetum coccineum]
FSVYYNWDIEYDIGSLVSVWEDDLVNRQPFETHETNNVMEAPKNGVKKVQFQRHVYDVVQQYHYVPVCVEVS